MYTSDNFCDLTYSGCENNRTSAQHPTRNPPGKTKCISVPIYNDDSRFSNFKVQTNIHVCQSCTGTMRKYVMKGYVCGIGICKSSLHTNKNNACLLFTNGKDKKRCDHCLSQILK